MRGVFSFVLCAAASAQIAPPAFKLGHSHLMPAFDAGPREKPWEMQGIGKVNFPITTKNPEVQKWFNQGIANAHNFWWFEAERAFRWCRKLEPENAMGWWGLGLSAERGESEDRRAEFFREAYKRRDTVSERERLYIEAWYAQAVPDLLRQDEPEDARYRRFREKMETLIVRYPEDLEAKVFLALSMMGDQRMGAEALLQQVLAKDPNHPGAHHYRIHNWNYHEPELVLDSCRRYGEIAWDTGHALHMPGHIYSTLGMWHEAAIAMDAATRSEARYMKARLVLPYNAWNYPHNKNYLCRILEQLGMGNAALDGARQLLATAPANAKQRYVLGQGIQAFVRNHVKFEHWNELLAALPKLPWDETPHDKLLRSYAETRALIAIGENAKVLESFKKHTELKKELEKHEYLKNMQAAQEKELRGRMLLARGEILNGLALMSQAAMEQFGERANEISLLQHPDVMWLSLGHAYLDRNSPALAIVAYEKALTITHNDGFALAGLVRAHAALGETEKAKARMAQLNAVWSDADRGLKPLEQARSTGISAPPKDPSPAPQRNYLRTTLDKFGPNRWEPYSAPALQAVDSDGKPVTLAEYKGKNVLLIFYLGDECPHCLDQLVQIGKRKADFERNETVILAISKDTPKENKESRQMGEVPFRLLSDEKLENARRFRSYDDFEEMELHSTILIDRQGRVHWAHLGGDPFMDFDFVLREIGRLNSPLPQSAAAARP